MAATIDLSRVVKLVRNGHEILAHKKDAEGAAEVCRYDQGELGVYPTNPAHNDIDGQKFDSIKKTVKEAADNAGFDCEVTGDLSNPGIIMDHVWQGIRGSDAVVADISGLNPNVFYEIGLAHALGKEVIIISSDKETPFDIRSLRHFMYDPENIESLRIELEDAFKAISARYPFEGNEPRY